MTQRHSMPVGPRARKSSICLKRMVSVMLAAMMLLGTFSVNLSAAYASAMEMPYHIAQEEPNDTDPTFIEIEPLSIPDNQVWVHFYHNIPGDGGAHDIHLAYVGSRLTRPIDPIRPNYRLVGWHSSLLNRDWRFESDNVPTMTGNAQHRVLQLTARWLPAPFRQDVRFHLQNGFGPQVAPNPIIRIAEGGIPNTSLNTDANLNAPPAPIPVWNHTGGGARFIHWGVSPSALYQANDVNIIPFTMMPPPATQADVTDINVQRYAIFVRQVQIHVYNNSISESTILLEPFLAQDVATHNFAAQLLPYESGIRHVIVSQPVGAPAGIHQTRAYTFRGWYVDADRTIPFTSASQLTFNSNGIVNLYAGYTPTTPDLGPNQLVRLVYHNEGENEDLEFYIPKNGRLYMYGNVNLPRTMPNAVFRGWTIEAPDGSRDFWVSGSLIVGPTVLEAVYSHRVTLNLHGGEHAASDAHIYCRFNYVFTLPYLTGATPPQHGPALTGVMHPHSPFFRRPDAPSHPTIRYFTRWSTVQNGVAYAFRILELPPNGNMHFATTVRDNRTFHANYGTIDRVTLTFNGGGGMPVAFVRTPVRGSYTSNLSSTTATAMQGNTQRPMIPRWDGFHFTEWQNDVPPHEIWTFGTTAGRRTIDDDNSFTAQWVPGFTVTFNSNGGSFATSQQLTHGDSSSIIRRTVAQPSGRVAVPLVSRAGFEFLGWYEDINNLNTHWNPDSDVTRNMNLTARWRGGVFVTFDAYPGAFPGTLPGARTRVVMSSINHFVSPLLHSLVPERTTNAVYYLGHSFMGWEYNGELWNFSNQVYDGQVFTARWQQTYIVNFYNWQGTRVLQRTANLHNHMRIPLPLPTNIAAPTRVNFQFTGWHTNANGQGEPWIFATTSVTSNMNLYQGWLGRYTVEFLLSTNPRDAHQVTHGILEGSPIPTPRPISRDWRGNFVGWYIYSTYPPVRWNFDTDYLTREVFVTGSMTGAPDPGSANPFTLVARWDYFPTVTLVFRDGTEELLPTVAGSGAYRVAPLPTLPRYPFYRAIGWFERDEQGNRIEPAITNRTPITRNMRLYAEYERYAHDVTYVLGLGKDNYVYTHSHNSPLIIPRNFVHPTNPEYSVIRWYLDAARTTPVPSDFRVTEHVNVYAQWGIIRYATVIFINVFGEEIARTSIRFGTSPAFPPPPFHPGFIFENYWYVGEHGTVAFVPGTLVFQSELILVASARHVVRFNGNGGQLRGDVSLLEIRHGHGIRPHDVDAPTREGYDFIGWFTAPDGTGQEWVFYGPDPHNQVRVNKTLYAGWRIIGSPPISDPWSSLASGSYPIGFQFALNHENSNARIYFTLDGSDPTPPNGTLYTRPITIDRDMVVRAIAFVDGYGFSEIVTYHYTVQRSTVTFDAAGGVPAPASVTVYTTRGLFAPPQPTRGSDEFLGWYFGDVRWGFIGQVPNNEVGVVRGDMTLVARWLEGGISPVAPPRSSLRSGEYPAGFQFALLHDEPGAVIHYTLDGTIPTIDSPVYGRPITIRGNMTLKAIAVVDGVVSGVAIYHYTVPGALPRTTRPWSSLPSGEYPAGFQFTLHHGHPDAVIHFTLDGTTPTRNSPVFVSPGALTITENMMLMAIAFVEGYDVSEVAVYHYTVVGDAPPERRIAAISFDGNEGIVDNTNNTITFRMPPTLYTGSILGYITSLVAYEDEIIFIVANYPGEHPRRLGELAGFATGDIVFVEDGIVYTLVIEMYPLPVAGRIYSMSMDSFVGVVCQDDATITFDIPAALLVNGSFVGHVTAMALTIPHDTVIFIINGFGDEEFHRSQGELAGFADGDLVFVADGIRYTLRINAVI